MASLISLCNEALALVNRSEISNLSSGDSREVILCKLLIPRSLAAAFAAYPWQFAIAYSSEQFTADHANDPDKPPDWKWQDEYICRYEWLLPLSCMRLCNVFKYDWTPLRASINSQSPEFIYARSSRLIDAQRNSHSVWSNLDKIKFSYVEYSEDPQYWPPYFCDYIVMDMAWRMAKYLADNTQYAMLLTQQRRESLAIAKAEDAQQQYFRSYIRGK
jgi:hypothetical protein